MRLRDAGERPRRPLPALPHGHEHGRTHLPPGRGQPVRCGRPPPAPEEIAPLFPSLEILECLGRGGMGVVYKARQKSLNRLVALKILAPERVKDPAFAKRFVVEAEALARLNHANIVTIHDFGQADGLFYFVMEYVDGLNLRQLLHSGRIAPREALAIVPQICDALQYAHDAGIVHRDIKPENILLDRLGRVKVADFGLAKLVGQAEPGPAGTAAAAAPMTEGGKVIGTPQYMAPEQTDHPSEVDHRADIYSLGVVFYQMLTGEMPGKKLEPPSKKVVIDVRLDEVVLRALEANPERRYQQVSQVKTMVETIVAEGGEEKAGARVQGSGVSPTGSTPAADASLRHFVVVGRRNGKAVIHWPGVLLGFILALAVLESAAVVTSVILEGKLNVTAVLIALCTAVMITGIRIRRGRTMSVESLMPLDPLPDSARPRDGAVPPAAPLDWRLWSPFQPPLVREIRAHMTEAEKRQALLHSALFGVWVPFFVFSCILLPRLLPTPVGSALAPFVPLAGMLPLPFLIKLQLKFLCSTAWAREQGIRPEQINRFNAKWAAAFVASLCVAVILGFVLLHELRSPPGKMTFRAAVPPPALVPPKPQPVERLATIPGGVDVEQHPGGPWIAALPGGTTVELVALASHKDTNAPAWRPDGTPYPEPFDERSGKSWVAGKTMLDVSFHIRSRTGTNVSAKARFDGGSEFGAMGSELHWPTARKPFVAYIQTIACPPSARSVNMQVGVADERWDPLTELSATGVSSTRDLNGNGGKCTGVAEKNGDAVATFSIQAGDADVRVLAVGTNGHEYESNGRAGDSDLLTVSFRGVSPKDIVSFRIQRRPFQWVEFRNVALQPGVNAPETGQLLEPEVDTFPLVWALFLSAPLSWFVVRRILRSRNPRRGPALALCIPLLVLQAFAIVAICRFLAKVIVDFHANPSVLNNPSVHPAFMTRLANYLSQHPDQPSIAGTAIAFVLGFLIVRAVWRAVKKPVGGAPLPGTAVPPASPATDASVRRASRFGKLALALCIGGVALPAALLASGLMLQTPRLMIALVPVILIACLCELAAIVLGIVGWKSGAGKAAVIAAALLPVLFLPGVAIAGCATALYAAAHEPRPARVEAAKSEQHRATPTVHDPAPIQRSAFSQAAHLGGDERSVFVVHDDVDLTYALFYPGDFGSASDHTHNPKTRAWNESGSITLKNGRKFLYMRQQGPSTLNILRLNGEEYDLEEGRVIVLRGDGTAQQLKLFPPLAVAREPAALAKLVADAQSMFDPPPLTSDLAAPPKLQFLAWQDENPTFFDWKAWRPDGERANSEQEIWDLNHLQPTRIDISATAEGRGTRILFLWFSHPDIRAGSMAEMTMIDSAGRALPPCRDGTGGSMYPANASKQESGWFIKWFAPPRDTTLPATINLTLKYSLGDWHFPEGGTVTRDLFGGTMETMWGIIPGAGETADGKAFVTLMQNPAQRRDEQVDFAAMTTDGKVLDPCESSTSGPETMRHTRFAFDVRLPQIKEFRLRTRPFRTAEYRNVSTQSTPVQQKADPAAAPTDPRRYTAVRAFVYHATSRADGCAGDAAPTGCVRCGYPGAVSEVSWAWLRATPQGDVYRFTRVFPHETPEAQTTVKEVTYAGGTLVVWEDAVQRIGLESPHLQFRLVAEDNDSTPADEFADPNDQTGEKKLRVRRDVLFDETAVVRTQVTNTDAGTELRVKFTKPGWKSFAEVLASNSRERLAVLVDGEVRLVPEVRATFIHGNEEIGWTIDSSAVAEVITMALTSAARTTADAPPVEAPIANVDSLERAAVEKVARKLLAAMRDKDDAALKATACDLIPGWGDGLPVFAKELRRTLEEMRGSTEDFNRIDEVYVEGDYAAVKAAGNEKYPMCLILFFSHTLDGWRNYSLRNAPLNASLKDLLATNREKDVHAPLQKRALALVAMLAGGKFAEARSEFDDAMRAAMPEAKLMEVWKQLADAGGKFLGADSATRVEGVPDCICVYVPCRWERNRVDLKVVFNLAGQVSGLWITPPERPPHSPAAVEAPAEPEQARQMKITQGDLGAAANELERFYALRNAARTALKSGQTETARKLATELADLAPKYKDDWNYGNAILGANQVLGQIALAEGNIEEAKKRLLASADSKGSPQMNSFGPNMQLAKELLEKGERDVVLEYFKRCGAFWTMGTDRLASWAETVNQGQMPDFGGNLDY
ncbi:MAG: protein kinase [Lentisphaerae bacterium]|nr:protein kinase [Lentisphaerota bacterium]